MSKASVAQLLTATDVLRLISCEHDLFLRAQNLVRAFRAKAGEEDETPEWWSCAVIVARTAAALQPHRHLLMAAWEQDAEEGMQ